MDEAKPTVWTDSTCISHISMYIHKPRIVWKPVPGNEFHPLYSKTCSFQSSCERTRTKLKLMPAADVHKLASSVLPPIKTGEEVHHATSKASPSDCRVKNSDINIWKWVLYVQHTEQFVVWSKPPFLFLRSSGVVSMCSIWFNVAQRGITFTEGISVLVSFLE
jgi:hypothetical protein